MTGKVLFWLDNKGYGFIKGEDKSEYIAHYSNIQGYGYKTLHKSEQIEFDKTGSNIAINIKIKG